ncbi:ATP-binding protein [Piscinibacter sp.]|uniref:ATP-binding protein n=1 Tax=Piscinibacter sp. TaxID=1903157 RepID=UPI0039E31C40
MPDAAALRLELCGAPRLLEPGGGVITIGPRLAALLALAALRPPLARELAAAWLYPELDAAGARRNLRQLLHKQRALVQRLLVPDGDRLLLAPGVGVDALQAPDADAPHPPLLLGTRHQGDLPALQAWLDGERERLAARWRQAVADRADDDEREGRFAAALVHAAKLVAALPTSEAAHRRVMRLHDLRGDRAQALAAFDACEQVLRDELSARPGPETLALRAGIEADATALARPTPAAFAERPLLHRPPHLIGRDAERSALADAVAAGRHAVVTGEGGIGKSRLLEEHRRARGEAGARALEAGGRPADATLPYALLARLLAAALAACPHEPLPSVRGELAHVLPQPGHEPSGRADALRLVRATIALLRDVAAAGVETIVIDDLHHADDTSLRLLSHVVAESGLAWVVAARPDELAPAGRELLAALDPAAAHLPLRPLAEAEVLRLVQSLGAPVVPGAPGEWLRRTGGNPLFVVESAKAWAAAPPAAGSAWPVPLSVERLVRDRIARLGAPALRLARCAAIAGDDFEAALASHVLGVPALDLADAWSELESAGLLDDGRYTHDLVRDAVEASVPAALARELHGTIAGWLLQAGRAAARVAWHAERAALWPLASAQWRLAGQALRQRGHLLEASVCHDASARAAEQAGDAVATFEARRAQAEARAMHLNDAESDALLAALQSLAGDAAQALAALQLRVHWLACRGEHAAAIALGRPALEDHRGGDRAVLLRIAGSVADAHIREDEPARALDVLRPFEHWVAHAADPATRLVYASVRANALQTAGRLRAASAAYEEALTLAQMVGDEEEVSMNTANLGVAHMYRGMLSSAIALAREARRLAEANARGERSHNVLTVETVLAKCLLDHNDYDEALALLEPLREAFARQRSGYWRCMCEVFLAQAWVQLGQPARALAALDAAEPDLSDILTRVYALGLRAEMAALLGNGDANACITAARALPLSGEGAAAQVVRVWGSRFEPPEAAAELLVGALRWAEAQERAGLQLAAHVRASEVERRRGDAGAALRHAEAAARLAPEAHAAWFYRGELWLELHAARREAGDAAGACRALDDGLDWLRVTLTRVPPPFRRSFLDRNPTNLALRRLGRSRGADTVLLE